MKNTPKFVKRGNGITVLPEIEPIKTEVDGRYGKREMYVIETAELGKVYITGIQLVQIDRLLMARGDYSEPLTWVPQ